MLRKLTERMHNEEKGFTLIELLVVILIIGILAAIALPAFLNQRGKAQDSQAKADARTAQTAMETYYTDNRTYATATVAAIQGIEGALKNAKNLAASGTADTFSVSVDSDTGNKFTIAKAADGTVSRTCTTADKNGCPAGGKW
jgi:type IV pilus assembly protein PilA